MKKRERRIEFAPTAPFLACGMRPFSADITKGDILQSREAYESYDPETQTSRIPEHAGTARTYSRTTSWKPGPLDDDDKVSDA